MHPSSSQWLAFIEITARRTKTWPGHSSKFYTMIEPSKNYSLNNKEHDQAVYPRSTQWLDLLKITAWTTKNMTKPCNEVLHIDWTFFKLQHEQQTTWPGCASKCYIMIWPSWNYSVDNKRRDQAVHPSATQCLDLEITALTPNDVTKPCIQVLHNDCTF